ncbi:hypothetical protein EYV94_03010 [Puteibacter caeruleilacunae]|nr:hypothetical protein EYV94_03010 [Puteibacter caeruleilacunae]
MKKLIILFVLAVVAFSCDQRVDLDEGQWGTHADVTSGIFLFQWKLGDVELAEGDVEGAKRESVTDDSSVDVEALTVTTTVKAGTDLTKVACYIYHDGEKVEPLNGAPVPGVISDYSAKEFKYRVFSADGKTKDWTLKIVE